MKSIAFLGFLGCLAVACAYPKTYVIPAQTARNCDEIEHVISLRFSLETAPVGIRLFCRTDAQAVYAEKLSRSQVKIQYSDGKEATLDLPSGDASPAGMATHWREGQAKICGMSESSPIGAAAYVLWGEFTLFFRRVGPDKMVYINRAESFTLNYPLTPEDRLELHKKSVPLEIANLLY